MKSGLSGNSTTVGLLRKLAAFASVRSKRSAHDTYVNQIVEQVVDSIDPRLRGVARYAWKIRPAVERMLEYADHACAILPGPIEFSTDAWSDDPCVRALFATATEMQTVFSQNPDIAEHFKSPLSTDAYVILGMQKTEKTVYGVEMNGQVMRRDVPQISVSFGDYRLSRPAAHEQELRVRLRERALNEFIAQALSRVAELSDRKEGIRKRKTSLQVNLKALERRQAGFSQLYESDLDLQTKISNTKKSLADVEQECSDIRDSFGTLSDVLEHVVAMLSEPEDLIDVMPFTLCLDKMNRLLEPREADPGQRITLAQVNFGKRFSRVGVLAKFPRRDFVHSTNQVDIDAALRYLG